MTMIRSRKTAVILLALYLITALIGCGYTAPAPAENPVAENSEAVNSGTENPGNEEDLNRAESEEEPSEEAPEAAKEVFGETGVYTGGDPWIDSGIKENLTEDMELSAKDDFNLYVNHDWLMSTDIPEGLARYNSYSEAEIKIKDKIVEFMNDNEVEGYEAELSQTLYHALLDWEARDKTGFKPAVEKIAAIMDIKNTGELGSFLCDTGKSCFVPSGIWVYNGTFFEDSSKYIVQIHDINNNLILNDSSEYKERSELGELYYKASKELSERMLMRAGFSRDEADTVFEGAIEFESQLAEYIPSPAEIYSPEYQASITNLYDMDGLKELYKAYPIEEYLKARGYGGAKQYQVTTPDYAVKLGSLYNEEHLEQIKDYMIIHFCLTASNKLDREAFETYTSYRNMFSGASGKIPEIEFAITMVRTFLPDAITKAYVDYYHLEDSKDKIRRLCRDIIEVYEEMLKEEEWLSEETKEKAIEKLRCMEVQSVYPDRFTDYESLEFTGDSLYECLEQAMIFLNKNDASHTDQNIDKGVWDLWNDDVDPLMTNAWYVPKRNTMYILAGIVEDPIYNEDMSDEEFYGSLGQVIGHEISHAFDTTGAECDKDGNFKNWWKKEDHKAFNERVEKLKKYYSSITIWTGLNASGELDHSELIADMGAMKAMLRLAKSKKDFDYETFFKANARLWRNLSSPEFDYYVAVQDPHPLDYLRANVVEQQFEEFYETFGVEEGDGMYLAPEDRVAVW